MSVLVRAALLSTLIAPFGIVLAASDPFVGTWVMDPQRSRYESAEVPRYMVIVMSSADERVHYRSQTTLSGGEVVSSEYTADYVGGLAIVVGSGGIMAPLSLRRIDNRTVDCSYMKAGRVVASSRRVVSTDGATMTITTVDGTEGINVAVFNKEP
jgi:hypothetical protein